MSAKKKAVKRNPRDFGKAWVAVDNVSGVPVVEYRGAIMVYATRLEAQEDSHGTKPIRVRIVEVL